MTGVLKIFAFVSTNNGSRRIKFQHYSCSAIHGFFFLIFNSKICYNTSHKPGLENLDF